MNQLLHVSLRQKAVFIPGSALKGGKQAINGNTFLLIANLTQLGYGVSEPLLAALNQTTPTFRADLLASFRQVMGLNKNWTPLVKDWDTLTGETVIDHWVTFFVNLFPSKSNTKLPCGHRIPSYTFPLERYNGCPFCGTPFEAGKLEHKGQGSKLKVLELWTEREAGAFLEDLLVSKTVLDATQLDSLKILLAHLPLPTTKIGMKETLMAVIDACVVQGQPEKVQALFSSPTDVLRYLWYKKTGFSQIIEPKTIIKRQKKNHRHIGWWQSQTVKATKAATDQLKLKYNRQECRMVAAWLNGLPLDAERMCEMMHPKRGIWVRFIRALRLAEYSQRAGFEHLKEVLDVFYNQVYDVWQGRVNHYRLRADEEKTLGLLKQRPGLFARSLFANMLWFGPETTIAAFSDVIDQVPARLVFTLNSYAQTYFEQGARRVVKPLGGVAKNVPAHPLLTMYEEKQLESMQEQVAELCVLAMKKRFAGIRNPNRTIYIDPMLFKLPVAIGDRSENVQDLPSALMGTRFELEGDTVRLFMQWGTGLPAQHLDMDLSCQISYASHTEICSFGRLVATGCKHSGDIRSIPHQVGTAEYIDINLNELRRAKARYVTFTCNAYSNGSLSPNLVVGWMNSRFPMKISEKTGVAYDPSCVQHQVRVTHSLAKGLVFGVLDVENAEVIWLEMPFDGQLVQNLSTRNVELMLKKLDAKLSIGRLLQIKAEAQGLELVEAPNADEAYTQQWASNTAAVTQLLVD
jgi:hypothetical protein